MYIKDIVLLTFRMQPWTSRSMLAHCEDTCSRFMASIQKRNWVWRNSTIWACRALCSLEVAWTMCPAQYWLAYLRASQMLSSTRRLGTSESRRNDEGKLQMLKQSSDLMMRKHEWVRRVWWEAASQYISIWKEVPLRVMVNLERAWVKTKSGNEAWYQKTLPSWM